MVNSRKMRKMCIKPPIFEKGSDILKKIKKIDINSVKITFENMANDKSQLGLALVEEAEFMKNTLEQLKAKVISDGVVTSMCQGKYDIDRANPALSQYNMLIKNYQSCINNIVNLLPKDDIPNEDNFDDDDL